MIAGPVAVLPAAYFIVVVHKHLDKDLQAVNATEMKAQICWIYFPYPTKKEPTEKFLKRQF